MNPLGTTPPLPEPDPPVTKLTHQQTPKESSKPNPIEMPNQKVPFRSYPVHDFVSAEDKKHFREHRRKLLFVVLPLLILMPLALALFLFVICNHYELNNKGHW